MTVRGLCSVLALAVATACGSDGPVNADRAVERVVFVSIDTLRADHLACYGYFRETSPFLVGLAERSVVFERATSPSSHTAR